MHYLNIVLAAGSETVEPAASAGGLGIGAYALMSVVALLLIWMAYLYINSRQSKATAREAAPSNLSPGISDDELENAKLTRVLRAALFGSVLVAVVMPWYAMNEPGRQEAFAEDTLHFDIEEGSHLYSLDGFECAACHGPNGGGGSNEWVEVRSGVDTNWAVPSINDVFYRYDKDEVRHWVVFGRAGTAMPSNGLEGGGSMTVQQIDQVMAYIESIQIPQDEAFAKSQAAADQAITRMENGAEVTQRFINHQEIKIEEVNAAPDKIAVVGGFPDDIKDLLQAPGTCTDLSAELVGTTCSDPGADDDRDGLSNEAERGLTTIAAISGTELTEIVQTAGDITYSFQPKSQYDVYFDPADGFTNGGADLDEAEALLSHVEEDVLLLAVTADRQDKFLEGLESGLAFLEDSMEQRRWEIDFDEVAANMGVSLDDAKLAVGLFNGYCARCHTSGYSAGETFVQGLGTGAWGPALTNGRTLIQFPDIADHIRFVTEGSEDTKSFGVNGLATGRMPAFGKILSAEQIELIVKFERSL